MKTIPPKIFKDYAILSTGFCLFFLLDPFNLDNTISNPAIPLGSTLQILGEGIVILLGTVLSELIVTFVPNLPCDYSKGWNYQIMRKIPLYILVIIILSAAVGQYFTVIQWGFGKWYYFWNDYNGSFSLKWFMNNFTQDLSICVFIAVYWAFLTDSRMKEYRIQELLLLNDVIDGTDSITGDKADVMTITAKPTPTCVKYR